MFREVMDAALSQLKDDCSSTDYQNAIRFLYIYIKNIHENPNVEKYRKIRTSNAKFNTNVWQFAGCRTILLMSGFEEVGEHIELSVNADVSMLYHILREQTDKGENSPDKFQAKQQVQGNTTLKLNVGNEGGGIFAPDVKADMTLLSYMVEMGYTSHAASKGLIATNNQGVQPAMDWIAEHPECHIAPAPEKNISSESDFMQLPSSSSSSSSSSNDGQAVTSRLRNANEQKLAYQEKLRLEAIKKAKLEKAEDIKAKNYLKKNLHSQRQETKEKFEREKVIRHDVELEEQQRAEQEMAKISNISSDVSVLHIKMHDGKVLTWETSKESTVKDLWAHIVNIIDVPSDQFTVCIPHPHEILNLEDLTTLKEKCLYPKATVVVQMLKQETTEVETEVETDETSVSPNSESDMV